MPPWPLIAAFAANVTPIDAASGTITGYLLGYGPLGVIALAFSWLLFRGWRLVPPGYETSVRAAARDDARADLLEERGRVLTEKARAEEERDDALRIARDQLVPALMAFNASVSALLPILQELVGRQGSHDRGGRRT